MPQLMYSNEDRYSNPRPVVVKKKAPREEPPPFKRRVAVDSTMSSSSGYALSRSITGSTKTSILSRTPIPSISSLSSVGTGISPLNYEPKGIQVQDF
jgi:hypothetical protein